MDIFLREKITKKCGYDDEAEGSFYLPPLLKQPSIQLVHKEDDGELGPRKCNRSLESLLLVDLLGLQSLVRKMMCSGANAHDARDAALFEHGQQARGEVKVAKVVGRKVGLDAVG